MSAATHALRSVLRENKAAVALEAAAVLPFVLVLGMGTIEFGWLMSQIESVQTSLRDSVRFASRSKLDIAYDGTASLNSDTIGDAKIILDNAYKENGISSSTPLNLTLNWVDNTNGSLYRGGARIYSITGTTEFTPASAGLLSLINITLPRIRLNYKARHVGG